MPPQANRYAFVRLEGDGAVHPITADSFEFSISRVRLQVGAGERPVLSGGGASGPWRGVSEHSGRAVRPVRHLGGLAEPSGSAK